MTSEKFQKLTPVKDANISIYKDALDFVFEDSDIKNVAISGAYGAGKSSVIETYKQTHSRLNFLHVSLAYFDPTNSFEKEQQSINENILEGKILNQLIHQIDVKKIPQTNFRIKHSVSNKNSFFEASGFLLFVVSLLYVLNFSSWKVYIDGLSLLWLRSLLNWSTNSAFLLCSYGIMIVFLVWTLYTIIQTQKNKNILKKISVQGNEIEVFGQCDSSYFDKYLNDVLYLFEKSDADVIVFEDLDRYNANQIFQRLREINTLVNNRSDKKPPIRFFYLLRDDIFASKDRTKFFDFIIPIVPILDSSNSYDKFIEYFETRGIFHLFNKNFLQGISLYVDDMRILKNIDNEFIIYNTIIDTTEQDVNKLLALIVYKNIFPRDFSNLQLNRGFVFNLFTLKDSLKTEKKVGLEKQINECNNKIERIKNEILVSEEELERLYSNRNYFDAYNRLKDKYVSEKDLRKELVHSKINHEIDKIQEEIQCLERQVSIIQNQKLSDLIDRENIESFFQKNYKNEIGDVDEFKEVKGSEYFNLLKYLIRNGFIDETYPDYMTYFYENSLSRTDKIFLRSVVDQKAKEYAYPLQKPDIVISRLSKMDFEKEETLNFDLLCFLLKNNELYSDQLTSLLFQLKTTKRYDFIIRFIEAEQEVPAFIRVINHQWPELWGGIIRESNYSDAQEKIVALFNLYFTTKEDLDVVNGDNSLSDFIAHCSDFLHINNPKTEIIIEKLEFLEIRFLRINYSISNTELWDKVYIHNLYELNWGMIETIIENQYCIPKSDDYNHKNLTLIFSKPHEALAVYVKNNINEYIELMFNHCEGKISDSEDVIVFTLEYPLLKDEHKEYYINKLVTRLSSIEKIYNTKWSTQIIDKELLVYTEENVLLYFFKTGKKYNNTLVKFINKSATRFLFDSDVIDEEYGGKSSNIFFTETEKCNDLETVYYKDILSSLKKYHEHFSLENINTDKVEILIELNIICMNRENLLFIREHYPDNVLCFIEKNPKMYVEETIDKGNFILNEALDALQSKIKSTYKVKLLKFTNEPISIQNKLYDKSVETYILENNFDKNDLPYLLINYDSLSDNSKPIVMNIVIACINDIQYAIVYTLLLQIMQNTDLNQDNKFNVLSFSISSLNQLQCRKCLEVLNANEYLSIFDGKRPLFKVTDTNKRIFNAFQQQGWLTKYKIEKNNFFRVIGRKVKEEK